MTTNHHTLPSTTTIAAEDQCPTTPQACIAQIIPAHPGWFAIRCTFGTAGTRGDDDRIPILVWALLSPPIDTITAIGIAPFASEKTVRTFLFRNLWDRQYHIL